MNKIERIDWDSSFFGYEVGKIQIEDINDLTTSAFIEKSIKFRLIYIFSKNIIDIPNIRKIDVKTILSQETSFLQNNKNILIQSFDINTHSFDRLRELAIESGKYSRFFLDKNFVNKEFERLYTRWIENALIDKSKFDVLVAIIDGFIVGFIALIKKSNTIVEISLLAVSQESRGIGIGKQLINESISKSKEAGFNEIRVTTQLDNIPAMSLYKSVNFKIIETINIYHLWNL